MKRKRKYKIEFPIDWEMVAVAYASLLFIQRNLMSV